jgi:hypothetical protein
MPPPPSVPPPVQVQFMSTQSQLDMPYVHVWSRLQGVEAMGCVAGQPFEPLPPAPPEPVVPPPVLELVALPAEPDVVVAEVAAPPAPAEPPEELSSPPQLVTLMAALRMKVPTIVVEAALFIDILPIVRFRPRNDKTTGRPASNRTVAFGCLRGSKSL